MQDTHLTQLHEAGDYAHKVAARERAARLRAGHVLVVQAPLPPRQPAPHLQIVAKPLFPRGAPRMTQMQWAVLR